MLFLLTLVIGYTLCFFSTARSEINAACNVIVHCSYCNLYFSLQLAMKHKCWPSWLGNSVHTYAPAELYMPKPQHKVINKIIFLNGTPIDFFLPLISCFSGTSGANATQVENSGNNMQGTAASSIHFNASNARTSSGTSLRIRATHCTLRKGLRQKFGNVGN